MSNSAPNSLNREPAGLPKGRPREFNIQEVTAAAKEVFWERGYQGSTLADLETATGLHRSSLYLAFGTKEALFAEALGLHIDTVLAPRLAGMELRGAGPRDVIEFFRGLARFFRDDAVVGRRGCLWVNSLAEFTGRKPPLDARAEYRLRLRRAFAHALSERAGRGSPTPRLVERRSRMLAATTFGIWLTARIDTSEAARLCDTVVAEVRSWGQDKAAALRDGANHSAGLRQAQSL